MQQRRHSLLLPSIWLIGVLLAAGARGQPALIPPDLASSPFTAQLRTLEPEVWRNAWSAHRALLALDGPALDATLPEQAAWHLLLAQSLQYLHLKEAFSNAVLSAMAAADGQVPPRIRRAIEVLNGVRLGRDGKYDEAIAALEATRTAAMNEGLPGIAVLAAAELAYARTLAGDHEIAMLELQQAHAEAVATKDRFLVAVVNEVIGVVYTYLDDFPAAIRHYRMALSAYGELGYQVYIAEAIYGIGIAHRYAAEWDEAVAALTQYRDITERNGSAHGQFSAAYGLATVYADRGDCPSALPEIERALALTGPEDYRAELFKRQAVCLAVGGAAEEAESALASAREIILGIPELAGTRWEIDLEQTEARMAAALGDYARAYAAMERYHEDRIGLLNRNASERRLAQRETLENQRQALEIELLQEQSRVRSLEIARQQQDLASQRFRVALLIGLVVLVGIWVLWRLRETRRLRRLSTQDALTGVWNRRHVFEQLRTLLAKLDPARGNLAVLLLDVDDFKLVNDEHGHPVGDAVLQAIAAGLSDGLRPGDMLARVGGEEFMVVLPRADADAASAVAERLNARVREIPVRSGRGVLTVTASIGIALSAAERDSAEALYSAADEALYRAKAHGKDRWEMA